MAHAAEAARALQPRATDTEVAPLCAEAAEVTSCGKFVRDAEAEKAEADRGGQRLRATTARRRRRRQRRRRRGRRRLCAGGGGGGAGAGEVQGEFNKDYGTSLSHFLFSNVNLHP